MNDIKVGDYVRLARNQGINRVEDVNDAYYMLEDHFEDDYGIKTCCLYKYKVTEEVLSHSENIIDLIECGDYVNGHIVTGFQEEVDINGYKHTEVGIESDRIINRYLKAEEIKSIVTHEQFNSIKYVLKGE